MVGFIGGPGAALIMNRPPAPASDDTICVIIS